jgi:hypothetical protein
MREHICTVSGQSAEANSNTIRISNDRNSCLDSRDAAVLLPHPGFVGSGVFRSPEGIHAPISNVLGERGGVPSEAGQNGTSSRSNGHRTPASDRRLTFPTKVKVLIGCVVLVFSGAVFMICAVIRSVMLLKGITLMSGLPWFIGGLAIYLLLIFLFASLMKIAALSDESIGGVR